MSDTPPSLFARLLSTGATPTPAPPPAAPGTPQAAPREATAPVVMASSAAQPLKTKASSRDHAELCFSPSDVGIWEVHKGTPSQREAGRAGLFSSIFGGGGGGSK